MKTDYILLARICILLILYAENLQIYDAARVVRGWQQGKGIGSRQ